MKFTYATLAIVVAVAQAQQISDIPSCAIGCFTSVLANNPCETLTDLACQCRQSQLLPQLAPCVQESCSPAEVETVRSAAQNLCASVGVNIEVPAEGGEEVTPPAETTAEEAAPEETAETTAETTAEETPEETAEATPEETTEETTTIQTQTTVQSTVTATAQETAETTEDAPDIYVYGSAPVQPTTEAVTTLTTATTTTSGVARPTGAVGNATVTTSSVVGSFTGAANQVAVGPVGGLVVFIVAAVYAL